MKNDSTGFELRAMTSLQRYRFLGLICSVIALSLVMVIIAMDLYNTSGAAQLDLSQPRYRDIQKQVTKEEVNTSYPANGPFDAAAYDTFRQLYAERAKKVTGVNSFDPTVLSEDTLQLLVSPQSVTTGTN
ncbi:MAG: hypothetical protein WBP14_02575 [Candidatus Saccharimonas aalborgensis]